MKTEKNGGNVLLSRTAKAVVDILLLIGLVLSDISARTAGNTWWSLHCLASMTWYALMVIHIWQHWGITVAVLKFNPNVLKRNKVTLLTIFMFIMLTISIILFIVDVSDTFVRIHHAITSPMRLVIIIHMITKSKQFVRLFRNANRTPSDNAVCGKCLTCKGLSVCARFNSEIAMQGM